MQTMSIYGDKLVQCTMYMRCNIKEFEKKYTCVRGIVVSLCSHISVQNTLTVDIHCPNLLIGRFSSYKLTKIINLVS
jgi:hypothetical protein